MALLVSLVSWIDYVDNKKKTILNQPIKFRKVILARESIKIEYAMCNFTEKDRKRKDKHF